MVEIENKYKIYEKKFGYVNWLGFYTLISKEIFRYLKVAGQTLGAPAVNIILFFTVLNIAIGDGGRSDALGTNFMNFLLPGLIAQQAMTQAFAHSSSSLIIQKIQGNIWDTLTAPLSAFETVTAIILASVSRGFLIGLISLLIFSFIIDIRIESFLHVFVVLFFSTFIMGALGVMAGQHANKFDELATIQNFLVLPASFLSGSFFSIQRLPEILQKVMLINPFFYMVDTFRFGFISNSDGSTKVGLIYLFLLTMIIWYLCWKLFKSGYRIKA